MDSLTGQQLLRKNGQVVSADEALEGKAIICYYFSAHWCPPCRLFTPILADFYSDLVKEDEPLEVVFVSSDKSPDELMAYMKEAHADWLAVQHGSALASDLKKKYNVTGIPTLIVVSRSGSVVSTSGRSEVTERGPQVFQNWLAATK